MYMYVYAIRNIRVLTRYVDWVNARRLAARLDLPAGVPLVSLLD